MTPFQKAREVYSQEACVRTFEQDLLLHYLFGFVFCAPDYFIMGRPVNRQAEPSLILDPSCGFERQHCNCWHIYLMAGEPDKAWSIMPWELPWFSFERRNELRFYPADRIRKLSAVA